MALVTLVREEMQGVLPPVCIRCGSPGVPQRRVRFLWYPPKAHFLILLGWLPWAFTLVAFRQEARIPVPVCDRHKNHWLRRRLAVLVAPPACATGFVLCMLLSAAVAEWRGLFKFVQGIGLLLYVSVPIVIVVGLVLYLRSTRAVGIGHDSIEIVNVHQGFADALRQHRRVAQDEGGRSAETASPDRTADEPGPVQVRQTRPGRPSREGSGPPRFDDYSR